MPFRMFLCVCFEPADGEGKRVGGSLLDNVVDEGLNEDVDLGSDVLLDFGFLLFHKNYRK
jgi:hypothetical protein